MSQLQHAESPAVRNSVGRIHGGQRKKVAGKEDSKTRDNIGLTMSFWVCLRAIYIYMNVKAHRIIE